VAHRPGAALHPVRLPCSSTGLKCLGALGVLLDHASGSGCSRPAGGLGLSPERLSATFLSAFCGAAFTIVCWCMSSKKDALQGRPLALFAPSPAPLLALSRSHLSEQAPPPPPNALPFVVLIIRRSSFCFSPRFWLPAGGFPAWPWSPSHLAFLLALSCFRRDSPMLCFSGPSARAALGGGSC